MELLKAQDMELYTGKMKNQNIKVIVKKNKEVEALKKALIKKGVVSENEIKKEKEKLNQ